MSWYPELSNRTMVAGGEYVRAIGWLSAREPFTQGKVMTEFVARLREFARLANESAEALSFGAFGGVHTCELCNEDRDARNFGVPAGPVLYVVPGMVAHYVEHHEYCPPSEFIAAVMASPLPDTPEYLAAVAEFGRLNAEWWEARFRQQQGESG